MNEEIYINRRAIFPLSDVVNGYDSLYIIEVKGSRTRGNHPYCDESV
jgi:hypothetical protein